MANIFRDSMVTKVGRNRFNLSHDLKLTTKMGWITPIFNEEVIPNDTWVIKPEAMFRFAPLVAPVMHKIELDMHFFFVPYRLLWPEWEDFITGETTPAVPTVTKTANIESDLGDYLGLPDTTSSTIEVSAFPIAAYQLVYDEYYRDQNLVNETFADLVSGSGNTAAEAALTAQPYKRAMKHSYFYSALPFAQKGDAVTLPLITGTGTATVDLLGTQTGVAQQIRKASDHSLSTVAGTLQSQTTTGDLFDGSNAFDVVLDPNGTLGVDINAAAQDITTLRRAFRLQEFLEKDARGGTRYQENTLTHFGIWGKDRRYHRPVYIGGSKQYMQISEVLSTAQSNNDVLTAEQVVGDMAGHGISIGGGNTFKFNADEHGLILGVCTARPENAFYQGLHRKWTRSDRLDYYWPAFAHIGEQEILNQEIYAEHSNRSGTFGYTPRYSDYKYCEPRIAGKMKSDLKYWHLAREFTSEPSLNSTFIECEANDFTRIFADTSGHHLIGHIMFNVTAIRPMPIFGNPTI
jgi:hypothetical protein